MSWICLLTCVSLAVLSAVMGRIISEFIISDDDLRNIVVDRDDIYIGGDRVLYKLSAHDLTKINSSQTCASEGNQDSCHNTILLKTNNNTLIVCGTDYYGKCALYNTTSLVRVNTSSGLYVYGNLTGTALGLLAQNGTVLYLGLTYNIMKDEKYYPISSREVDPSRAFAVQEDGGRVLYLKKGIYYLIYFRAVFQTETHIFFLTNQKYKYDPDASGNSPNVSKLIRICKNDSKLYSYIDLQLECSGTNGEKFNLVQHGSLIKLTNKLSTSEKDLALVATFAIGDNPQNPQLNRSAICLYTLTEINKRIIEAQRQMVSCNGTIKDSNVQYRYLMSGPNGANCQTNDSFAEIHLTCSVLATYENMISFDVSIKSKAILLDDDTVMGKIAGRTVDGGYNELLAGTQSGNVTKITLFNTTSAAKYDTLMVESGQPVEAIHLGTDADYFLTRRKLVKVDISNCSQYMTCDKCQASKNPHCGWCIVKERCTAMSSCRGGNNTWLPTLQGCVSLEVSPKATPIGSLWSLNITLDPFPSVENATYTCNFIERNKSLIFNETATRKGVMLSCTTSPISKHTTAELAIYMTIDSQVVKLASVDFRFYNCSEFSSCISCTSDSDGGCNWCVSDKTVVCATIGSCPSVTSVPMYNFTKEASCPRLLKNAGNIFAAANETTFIVIQTENFPALSGKYQCRVKGLNTDFPKTAAELKNGVNITCPVLINVKASDAKQSIPIEVLYPNDYPVDDKFGSIVEVYNCEKLGPDCSQCRAMDKNPYHCRWCNRTTTGCFYKDKCTDSMECEAPEVISFLPKNGPVGGRTCIAIQGRNFGISADEIDNITVAGADCKKENDTFRVTGSVTCVILSSDNTSEGPVKVSVRGKSGFSKDLFIFKDPSITNVLPTTGPMAGGTNITISGKNLVIGNEKIQVKVSNGTISRSCEILQLRPGIPAGMGDKIICRTPPMEKIKPVSGISLIFDEKTVRNVSDIFTYLENPVINSILPNKSMASGGIKLTITGEHLNNAHDIQIGIAEKDSMLKPCNLESGTRMICNTPQLSKEKREILNRSQSNNRRKRSTYGLCAGCFEIVIKLDGYEKKFNLFYTVDPSLLNLTGDNSVHIFSPSKDSTLTLRGNNLLWERGDIIISIGYENCALVEIKNDSLSCNPPAQQPGSVHRFPDVSVQIGNFKQTVGYLRYEIGTLSQTVIIIIASIAGVLFLVLVLVAVICFRKSRHLSRKAEELEKQIQDLEMEIRNVSREEFADLQTSIKEVTSSLVERGFPYRDYQYYSFKMLFPTADMDTHIVMLDPEVSDVMRIRLKKGMDMLGDLIYNKFFLKSLIQTMERQPQKKFSQRERAHFSSVLSVVLLGKMDYFYEILEILLPGLVQESVNKKSHKALFRRCESVTEKLLMNLFSLCLYPYLKKHGSSLYMMFKAIQIRMEKGPIDQLTGHAKYTLSEDQLLKKQSATGNELVLESKPLKLSVSVLDQYYECIVLDCDTITQVKDKCLAQIYINFPASNRGTADDVVLEWHAGSSGCLQLHDLDVSNHVSDGWKRLNTLAHYNVWDGCKMALVETNTQEDDYVNLSPKQIQFEITGASESVQLMPSSPQSSTSDAETPQELKLWHVVKPEDESQKRGKTKDIVELYLNRLLSMKISILPYIKELFDSILDANGVPTMVKTLYDLLDDLADQHTVDEDTLHVWKSHSYPIRFWAGLITKPDVVFDINKPGYTDQCLEIISQTFIDSFSTTSHNVNKESATHKLLFTAEMDEYRDKVHEFYSDVKSAAAVPAADFQQDMKELNKDQNRELTYSKMSALYELFKVIDSFMVDVIDDLQESPEARTLRLADRLDELVSIIKESEEEPSYSKFPDSHE